MRTINHITQQDEHVVDDVLALGGCLEDALGAIAADKQGNEAVDISLDGLLALLLADLVDGLDLLEVGVGDGLCAHSALPRDGAGADVVLDRRQVGGRVRRRHGGRADAAAGGVVGDVEAWRLGWGACIDVAATLHLTTCIRGPTKLRHLACTQLA